MFDVPDSAALLACCGMDAELTEREEALIVATVLVVKNELMKLGIEIPGVGGQYVQDYFDESLEIVRQLRRARSP